MNKILIFIIIFTILSCSKTIKILPNQIGIIVNEKGDIIDENKILDFGIYKISNHEDIIYFDISHQSKEFKNTIKLKDTVKINFAFTVYFRPIYEKAPILYKLYENDYIEKLLTPKTEIIINTELKNYRKLKDLDKESMTKMIYDRIKAKSNYNYLIEVLDVNVTRLDTIYGNGTE